MTRLLVWLTRIYRNTLGKLMLHSCRFLPTCSVYAEAAWQQYGWRRGTALTVRRLSRCHPWGGHGIDPLP